MKSRLFTKLYLNINSYKQLLLLESISTDKIVHLLSKLLTDKYYA